MANSNLGLSRDLAKSDTANDPGFNWLMVTGTAGSIVLNTAGGDEKTLSSVPLNVWIPVGRSFNVKTASTAVGIMVV